MLLHVSEAFYIRTSPRKAIAKSPVTLTTHTCAARPVKHNEYNGDKAAMDAYWKEWKNLE